MTGSAAPIPGDPLALRPRSVGEMLDTAFTLYRQHFGALAVVVLVCAALPTAAGLYLSAVGTTATTLILRLVVQLVNLVLNAVATGATVFIISESYLGRRLTAGDALQRAMPLAGRIVVCTLLMTMLILLGFVVLIVPGFIAVCGLLLATPVIVLEPERTASAALSRSWELTTGAKWRMFALLFTGFILLVIPVAAAEVLAAVLIPGATKPGSPEQEAAAALVSLIGIFITPLLSCLLTVAYYDLRVRKEGFDLEVLATSLQPV